MQPNDEDAAAICRLHDLLRFGSDGATRNDGDATKTGGNDAFYGARSDGWQIEASVLTWFRGLDQHTRADRRAETFDPAKLCDTFEHLIRSLRRLDGDHMAVGDDDRLANVQRTDRPQHLETQHHVRQLSFAGRYSSKRALVDQNFRRDLMRAEQSETVILQHARHTRQEMIVTAVEMADRTGQHAERRQVELDQLSKTRPNQRADKDHVAAAIASRQAKKASESGDVRPMMRVVLDALRISPAAQSKEHNAAPLADQ